MPPKALNPGRFLLKESLSNSSSRSASVSRTPNPDGEENGSLDVNFQSIDELLTSKLESLQSYLEQNESKDATNDMKSNMVANSQDYRQKHIDHMNKNLIQSGSTTINEIIYSLSSSRTEVSSESREMLLAQLFKMIVSKPLSVHNEENAGTEQYVSEDSVSQLIKVLMLGDYRSSTELLLLYRSIIALIASDIDEFSSLISADLLAHIDRLIQGPPSISVTYGNKANIIHGLSGLLLILHNDSSAFGIDEKVKWLIELGEGYAMEANSLNEDVRSGNREHSTVFDEKSDRKILNDISSSINSKADVAVACLHGAGCLLTLLTRGDYLNEFLSEIMPTLVMLVDNDDNLEISKAAGRVIAMCYEAYTYSEADDDEIEDEDFNYNAPYYEQEYLISIIARLANLTSKKVSKKEKKESHSIFRNVLTTLECYTNQEKRNEIYKRSPEGIEIINSLLDSTYVKLSKSKSLAINSWFLYLRLIHLKWCFGFGVHSQLVSNESVRSIMKEPLSIYQQKYGTGQLNQGTEDLILDSHDEKTQKHTTDFKSRSIARRKARINKLDEELEQLEIKK